MNKSELIGKVAAKTNLNLKKVELAVNSIFNLMFETLVKEERIEIRGLGSWYIKNYKSYVGRNPKTGESVTVQEKKLPFFKVGKDLKERVDSQTGEIIDKVDDADENEGSTPGEPSNY